MTTAAAPTVMSSVTCVPGGTRHLRFAGVSAGDVFTAATNSWGAADEWCRGAAPVLRREDDGTYSAKFIIYSAR